MVGLAENKATQPSLAGAWAEHGNIVSHLIPQKQTFAIPKLSVPFFFTLASSRGAFAPKNTSGLN